MLRSLLLVKQRGTDSPFPWIDERLGRTQGPPPHYLERCTGLPDRRASFAVAERSTVWRWRLALVRQSSWRINAVELLIIDSFHCVGRKVYVRCLVEKDSKISQCAIASTSQTKYLAFHSLECVKNVVPTFITKALLSNFLLPF